MQNWYQPLWIAALACLLLACEEDVVSVLGTDRAFTMYGVLNPQVDTQFVRVFPIEGVLVPNERVPLAATFESENTTTGDRLIWNDSLVAERGGFGHIFWAPFRVEYGHAYRITLVGEDGRRAEVSVAVPPFTEPDLGEPTLDFNVTLPVRFAGAVPRLIRTEIAFAFQYAIATTASGTPVLQGDTLLVRYDDRVARNAAGLEVRVSLTEAARLTRERAGNNPDFDERFGVFLQFIRLDAIVANEEWNPPDGTFDPYVLVQPGVMSNVENGFGFVGAGYRVELRWQPSVEIMEAAGFSTAG